MIDPELKYCPKCGSEYHSHIEMCAPCNVALLPGKEILELESARLTRIAGRKGEITMEDKLVTIQAGSLPNMKHLKELLSGSGIESMLVGDEKSCGSRCCPTVIRLMVREEEAPDAMEIINKDFAKSTALKHHDTNLNDSVFNPYASETVCPACGCTFKPTASRTCPDCGLCFG